MTESSVGATTRPWWKRVLWLVLIWALSVAALGVVAYGLRLVMAMVGLTR